MLSPHHLLLYVVSVDSAAPVKLRIVDFGLRIF
jgi:hypothetical protein